MNGKHWMRALDARGLATPLASGVRTLDPVGVVGSTDAEGSSGTSASSWPAAREAWCVSLGGNDRVGSRNARSATKGMGPES